MRIAEEGFFEHLRALNDGKKEFSLNRTRANHFTSHLLRPAIEKARILMTRVHLVWAVNDSWSIVVLNSAIFAVVAFGYGVLHLPSAIIVQFVIGGLFIVSPFSYFAQTAQPVGVGLASLRHLERIGMDLQADVQPLSSSVRPEDSVAADWKQIQLDDLTYRYAQPSGDESAFGVGPVTFSIQRGETLFFIGGNGSC